MERRHMTVRKTQSPVLPFAERIMWKDPALQPAKLRSSWLYGLWLGRSQTSNAHLMGTRVGIVVARSVRRLPTSEREESISVVAMRGTPVAAGDVHTVTRHAVEQREVIVAPASSGAPLQVAVAETSAHLPIQFQICLARRSRRHIYHQG